MLGSAGRMGRSLLLAGHHRQAISIRMRGYLLQMIGYEADEVPRMVEVQTTVLGAMLDKLAGVWLRRYVKRQGIKVAAGDVYWGWAATEAMDGWLQLEGGRPRKGAGSPVVEWKVQAAEQGGWAAMRRQPDTPWMITFRLNVLQALRCEVARAADGGAVAGEVEASMVTKVWVNSAKAATRAAAQGLQSRELFDLALVQLDQQGQIRLALHLRETLRAAANVKRCLDEAQRLGVVGSKGSQPQLVATQPTQVVRDVVVDICAGRQSMKGPARRKGFRYVAVDWLEAIGSVRGTQRADVVLDVGTVDPALLLQCIAELAGIQVQEILFIWASVPCDTMSAIDPSNQRTNSTFHRECSDYTRIGQGMCSA